MEAERESMVGTADLGSRSLAVSISFARDCGGGGEGAKYTSRGTLRRA